MVNYFREFTIEPNHNIFLIFLYWFISVYIYLFLRSFKSIIFLLARITLIFFCILFYNILGGYRSLLLVFLALLEAELIDLLGYLDPVPLVLVEIGGKLVQILVVFSWYSRVIFIWSGAY